MIGIIDSGFGGLSVVAELQKQQKNIPFIYIGDNANVPYGVKTTAEIRTLALNMIDYLLTNYAIDGLIIACNTIVAACLDDIVVAYPNLYIENIVAHGALGALQSFQDNVTVLATNKTVSSGVYARYIGAYAEEVQVTEIAAPSWVTMVEEQKIDQAEVKRVLAAVPSTSDVIILGCTHFPFLYEEIRSIVPEGVQIIDPAYSCVQQLDVAEDFEHTSIFLTSGATEPFMRFLDAQGIMHAGIPVEQIKL